MRNRNFYYLTAVLLALVVLLGSIGSTAAFDRDGDQRFQRIGSFQVYLNTDISEETVSEIVATTRDGRTLVYTDAATGSVGFVDINDPTNPLPLGVLPFDGEPTSVEVWNQTAYVVVNTSPDFVNTSGKLYIIDVSTQTIQHEFELGGQPDSIALNHNGRFVAIVIENERDEDLGDGRPPQAPPGRLLIFNTNNQTFRTVELTGIADLFPDDPEPEYVSINHNNIAVVTLQENNHIVLVDLQTGLVIDDFSAGSVDLDEIDTNENDYIELNGSLTAVPREPDAVAWITDTLLATANEGDLDGGSRGFTIFDMNGSVVFSSGSGVEHIAASYGHYPEDRSENKGTEPEGVEFGHYSRGDYLFVGTERGNLVLVYSLDDDPTNPEFVQALPGGIGPEGLLAIPNRNLLVTAAEVDAPGGFRSIITIYKLKAGPANYPTIQSANTAAGVPITWGALSALAADPNTNDTMYTIRDSYYNNSSFYEVDLTGEVPTIINETLLNDATNLVAAVSPSQANGDGTVHLDAEGIAVRADGGFWIASEGAGTSTTPNFLVRIDDNGDIVEVVELPASVNARQQSNGFEGVTSIGSGASELVFVAFQREWIGDPAGFVRIGRYEVATAEWTFFYYPLEAAPSGAWIGLSEITALDANTFAVVERDNQADVYATIKHIYTFSIAGLTPLPDSSAGSFEVGSKTLLYDLLPDLAADGGVVLDKVEGFAVLSNGTSYAVTDNDGVDGFSGETQLMTLEGLFD